MGSLCYQQSWLSFSAHEIKKISFLILIKAISSCYTINPLLTKVVHSKWLDIDWMNRMNEMMNEMINEMNENCWIDEPWLSSIKTQKKNSANIQPSWSHTWSITHVYDHLLHDTKFFKRDRAVMRVCESWPRGKKKTTLTLLDEPAKLVSVALPLTARSEGWTLVYHNYGVSVNNFHSSNFTDPLPKISSTEAWPWTRQVFSARRPIGQITRVNRAQRRIGRSSWKYLGCFSIGERKWSYWCGVWRWFHERQ